MRQRHETLVVVYGECVGVAMELRPSAKVL